MLEAFAIQPFRRAERVTVMVLDATPADLPPHLAAPRRRPTQIFPPLRPVAVAAYQAKRWIKWHTSGVRHARTRTTSDLEALAMTHSSPLLRKLGTSQMWLQHNKVTNLRIVAAAMDGVLVRPGETFSFCRLVGQTTKRKGYLEGMVLEEGQTVPGVGGGICQLANLLHWMVLHTPLTVTDRSTHSEDPFPDEGRVIPWGTGCTIFYNYVDLQFRNDTQCTYQVRVRVGESDLEGELRAEAPLDLKYHVYARDERFLKVNGKFYRANQIWRDITSADGRTTSELIKENFARTLYEPRQTAG